jgi:hypothetical protein
MPRPSTREEPQLEKPSEIEEELQESEEFEEESSSGDKPLPDISEDSQSPGKEPSEEE